MGVRGLARYAHLHEAQTSRAVPSLHGVTLAVDFVGFQFFVCQEVAKQVEAEGNLPNSMWLLLGGCPIRLEQYVETWLQRLEAARIKLLFVADPPQCFLGVGHAKTMELQDRAQQKVQKLRELSQSLLETKVEQLSEPSVPTDGQKAVKRTVQLREDKREQMKGYLQDAQGCFPFSREKLRSVLMRHGVRIETATKEADEVLAQLVRDGKAYAVLANDSDFLVMRGVQYIPFYKLRTDDRRAGVVSARVFSPELLAESLELDASHLVEVALLCTNDFTQQLDVDFQFSQVMNFPRSATNRLSEDAITPELAAVWIRTQQSSILDNPRVKALYASHGSVFLNALGAFYQFYGYGDEFRQRYHISQDIRGRMSAAAMQEFKILLDNHGFPSSLIDVLYSRTRRLKQQYDILATASPYRGKSLGELLAPARTLLYQALGVSSVRELLYDPVSGHHRQRDIAPPVLNSLSQFLLSNPIGQRSQQRVENAWRSLVFNFLYGDENGVENALFLWKLVGRRLSNFKTIVSSLLFLWKCDKIHLPRDGRLATRERLEVLLLTSLVCISLKEDRIPHPYDFEHDDLSIEWEVYASVGAFVEILRVTHFVRAVLGEKVSALESTCPSLFSAEVFATVYSIIRATRARNTPVAEERALLRAQVDSVLCYYVSDLKYDDAGSKVWDQFCQLRTVLNRLVGLVPSEGSADDSPNITPPLPVQTALATSKLLVPSAISSALASVDDSNLTSRNSPSTTPPRAPSTGKKKSKKNTRTPRGSSVSQSPQSKSKTSTGKVVRADDVVVRNVLSATAPEFKVPVTPPLPIEPPPPQFPPPLSRAGKKSSGAQRRDLAKQTKRPQPKIDNSISPEASTTLATVKGTSVPTLTPAAVAKRLGKTSSGSKKKGAQRSTVAHPPPGRQDLPLPPQSSSDCDQSLRGLLQRLPVFSHRHEILKNIASNQLTIIQGETGCGKSTSVPQFILDEWLKDGSSRPVSVYVTQPRRIAAIELAKTVASMREENEFGEDGVVGKVVGYRIGQKHCTSDKTKITYVTTGYMVERLIHDPDALQSMTHLVIDEVHERSMDVDTLLLLLKLQLKNHHSLRIVIMSATMDAKVLIKYFSKVMASKLVRKQPLFVGTKLFPVHNLYIEDMVNQYPYIAHAHRNEFMRIQTELQKVSNKFASANGELGQSIIQNVHDSQIRIIPSLIQQLITEHHYHLHRGGVPQCILVFLPGIGSINRLYEELGLQIHENWNGVAVSVSVLHSSLELEQQQIAFAAIGGMCTKIILATNLAESSVTIPDVTHVINCGMEKQIQMPNARSTHAEVLVDVWCSRASVLQRSGRAGRLMPGVAFHLFSKDFFSECMAEFTTPEILRKPLDRIVLQMKGKLNEFGVPSDLLKQALDAPDLNHIDGAYKLLAQYDAIDSEDEQQAQITSFGSFVCHMPLSMELCRLILVGAHVVGISGTPQSRAHLLANAVIVVAILASPDLFVMPSWFHSQSPSKYMQEMKQNLQAKLAVDGGVWSEPLAMWRLYVGLLSQHSLTKRVNVLEKLKKQSISTRRYQTMNLLISDTCERLVALGRQGLIPIDQGSMDMLFRLDNYASSQRVDKNLLDFAKAALTEEQHDMQVLRFLVIHNYADRLVTGRLTEGSLFDDDDDEVVRTTDRIDLSIGKEDGKVFFALSSAERKTILRQLGKNTEDFTNIAYSNNEVSLYSRVLHSAQTNDEPAESMRSFEQILPRMSLPVSLAYYIRDPKFPIDFGRVNAEGKEEKLRFRISDSSGSTIGWAQANDGVRVNIGGRSLFSLPVRATGETKLFAVYADRLFTGDETRMFCSKCTLLPPDAIAYRAILILSTVRRNSNVWIQVDSRSQDIVAVKVDKQLVAMPAKTVLRRHAIELVNSVRDIFSSALQCSSNKAEASLLPVETIVKMCSDNDVLARLTKEESRGRVYEWQQLSMTTPTAAERAEFRLLGKTIPRFPPLV